MNELPGQWQRMDILVVVKTYPTPSQNYEETVCTAGVTKKGEWIRLYPIRFRYLEDEKKFSKYQWISVEAKRRKEDYRPESYTPNLDTVIMGPIEKHWARRGALLLPTAKPSLEVIQEGYARSWSSLGMFKPKKVHEIVFEKRTAEESREGQKQLLLFSKGTPLPLEILEHRISYRFECNNPNCKGHKLSIIDWEAGQLYRRLRKGYEIEKVKELFCKKWLEEMFSPSRDSYLIVGNHYLTPTFMVLGVFWPPINYQLELFSGY